MARTTIPNPPGILKCYATPQGMKIFADDRSLQAVRKLVRSARTFWDVGANCGLFSLFGRGENPDLFIVSIEASTLRYQTLSSNWALQPSERWLCLHTAVGDRGVETHLSRHGSGFDHIIEDPQTQACAEVEIRPAAHRRNRARIRRPRPAVWIERSGDDWFSRRTRLPRGFVFVTDRRSRRQLPGVPAIMKAAYIICIFGPARTLPLRLRNRGISAPTFRQLSGRAKRNDWMPQTP